MDIDGDLGMFVNEDDSKIYYFHPSGYLKLAAIKDERKSLFLFLYIRK